MDLSTTVENFAVLLPYNRSLESAFVKGFRPWYLDFIGVEVTKSGPFFQLMTINHCESPSQAVFPRPRLSECVLSQKQLAATEWPSPEPEV